MRFFPTQSPLPRTGELGSQDGQVKGRRRGFLEGAPLPGLPREVGKGPLQTSPGGVESSSGLLTGPSLAALRRGRVGDDYRAKNLHL